MDLKEYMVTRKREIREADVKPRNVALSPNPNFITSIIGPRRAGKTFLIYHTIKKLNLDDSDYIFINFEESPPIDDAVRLPYLHQELYGKLPKFLFFDEIQNLNNWEKIVYFLYEKKKFSIVITGSSSKLLGKEIATQLRGRSVSVDVFPLSFEEVLSFLGIRKPTNTAELYDSYSTSKLKGLLNEHLKNGCFPDIVLHHIPPKTFFRDYFDILIYKDLMERYGIRSRFELEFYLRSLISSFSKEFSTHKVFNSLKSQGIKTSKTTLYNFQKIVEDIRFAFFLKKIEKSIRKIELSIPKIYLVDNGFYFYLEGKEDKGRLMENFVFLELLKKGFKPNTEIFYWKDYQQREVDFVTKENNRVKQLIQVAYASSFNEIDKREIRALLHAKELFKEHKPELLVITWDYEDEKEIKGKKIKFVPLWKWLLK